MNIKDVHFKDLHIVLKENFPIFFARTEGKEGGENNETDRNVEMTAINPLHDKYNGKSNNGQRSGRGVLTLANGDTFDGMFENGVLTSGSAEFKSGDGKVKSYKGCFMDGKMHGKGKCIYRNNMRYDGDWENGVESGDGIKYIPGVQCYGGTFKNGEYDGYFIFSSQHLIGTGVFIEGRLNGKGRIMYACGISYEGDFKNGNYHGFGIKYIYKDNFKDGNYHGFGIDDIPYLSKYEGYWEYGKENGKGTYTNWNGVYEGDYIDGKKHGYGILEYSSGNKYDGYWKFGKRHGEGTMTYADQRPSERGEWKDDQLESKQKIDNNSSFPWLPFW